MKTVDNLPERQGGTVVIVTKKLTYSLDDVRRALGIPVGARVTFAGNEWESEFDQHGAIVVRIGESK